MADSAIEKVMTAFEEFKSTNDAALAELKKKGVNDPIVTEKLGKIEATLASFEDANQKATAALLEAKKAAEEEKKHVDELEEKLNRLSLVGAGSADKVAERKAAVNKWARAVVDAGIRGLSSLPGEQRKSIEEAEAEYKAMSVGNDTTGGYLAPMEYVREIIKGVTEISPVRSLVRVRSTASKAIQIPKRTGQFAAQWVAEQGTRSETDGLRYGMWEIPTHELYALIDISEQNLEDSAFDMESEIRGEAAEQFSLAEGTAVVTGNGVGKPEGWMSASGVGETNSGSATTIADADGQANGLLTLKHAIETAYTRNAAWALNRTTLGSVRRLKDAQKNYIWMPGIALGKPNTIDGDPYVEVPDMPSEGAGTYPIAYGDFAKAYTLVDRIQMSMLRDPYTQATSGNIRFLFRRRLGGQVVLAEAIRKLKCAA
ncbi:phage major capsid protein [Sinorhizobium meliloti]|uniref:phage major capsid protein n=1 Tax=Rhizobium meliloti TaxID=382 RepID=UPI003F13E0EF